jgi:enoyl-CoA hydratase
MADPAMRLRRVAGARCASTRRRGAIGRDAIPFRASPRIIAPMIERESHDGIVTLRLAHGKASALDVELLEALDAALEETERAGARAVVLTGSGSIFSAGVDLFRLTNDGAPYVARFFPILARAVRRLFTFPRPVVAAINGHAIAGGCVLAEACDHRLMAEGKGRIGVPELLVGVSFPALVLEVLRFAAAPQHLQEIVYGGQTFGTEAALAKGLVDEVVAPEMLAARAQEVASHLASIDPAAFAITKRQLRADAIERAERMRWADDEGLALWSASATHDHIRAYLAKTVGKKT